MSLAVSIDAALQDENLLGAALGPAETWGAWLVALKAAFGRDLSRAERRTFSRIAGNRKPPRERVRELWAIIGRRGGKSRMAAALAVFIAAFIDHRARLAAGEIGYVLILAASKAQAGAVLGYVQGFLEASPVLRQMVEGVTSDEIRLAGNIAIAAHPNNFRTVRGRTLLCAIFDEVAYWRDESTALPDVETYRAVLPALATTGGMLVGISSPYRQIGLLHARHRDHFGKDNPDVLVLQGPTELFNAGIDRQVIKQAHADDPAAALSEWGAEFRTDIAQFLPDEVIDDAIDRDRPLELPPRRGIDYFAFADASAGRHDSFTFCIAHREDDKFVADLVRGRKPPFDPPKVAAEYAVLAREYRCREITGDAYAGEWTAGAFKQAGIDYRRSKLPKSGLYLESLPFFMRGAVAMPDLAVMVRELRLLERRTSRSGKDSVDHPAHSGHDDHVNALCGAMFLAMRPERRRQRSIGVPIFGNEFDVWELQ